jgi:integrase/recombinase XerD
MTAPIPIRAAPTPDHAELIALAINSVTSPHTAKAYRLAIARYLAWGGWPPSRATLNRYRAELLDAGKKSSTVNVALASVRCVTREAESRGLLPSGTFDALAGVLGVKNEGSRAGNWLDIATAKRLLELPDGETMAGKRDKCLLALLLGAALRRQEAASLTVEHIATLDGRLCIVDLVGKRRRVRTVPLPEWAAASVREWAAIVRSGPLLRSVDRDGAIGARLTVEGVRWLIDRYSERLGIPFAPHDLRRTAATLAYKGGSRVRAVQAMLGHSSVATTERYLAAVDLLADPAGDKMGL